MSAAAQRWRQDRHRLRSALRAIGRDDLRLAAQLLAAAELEAFERDDKLAGDLGYARYMLGKDDRTEVVDVVRRILERRYG